jgi:hypothetical protein
MSRKAVACALLAVLPLELASASEQSPGISAVDILGTEFRITLSDGRVLSGSQILGAVLTVGVPDGEIESIRIDGVGADPEDPEIMLYDLSLRDKNSHAWRPLCHPDVEGLRKAFPMKGTLAEDGEYRPDAPGFSLTCTSGVQAKCVRWGYKPWKPDIGAVRMLDLYRSCMRMARADYCGNGLPATRDGTPIDMFDVAGIQKPEPGSAMEFEAAWGPNGAICVRHTRFPEELSLDALRARCPKLKDRLGEACSVETPDALLFNKSN